MGKPQLYGICWSPIVRTTTIPGADAATLTAPPIMSGCESVTHTRYRTDPSGWACVPILIIRKGDEVASASAPPAAALGVRPGESPPAKRLAAMRANSNNRFIVDAFQQCRGKLKVFCPYGYSTPVMTHDRREKECSGLNGT